MVETPEIEALFGSKAFGTVVQKERLPAATMEALQSSIDNMTPLSPEVADAYASALEKWALEHGATHFTHWFQPMTGGNAQKHDSFLKRSGKTKEISSSFTGKTLLRGEPDGSSFPNGGLRQTHEARGYTSWDPAATPFIQDHGNGSTLMIPTVFHSWKGDALDERLPLLRSTRAMKQSILNLMNAAGSTGHETSHVECGIEQEFFLIDREHYVKRPDLVELGRTIIGKPPCRGQSLDDQYFADMSDRMLSVINDAERELWSLGIPMICRHREVAPGQYEVAPLFSDGTHASDTNMMLMSTLQKVARKHNVAALYHEKPFAGLNGSGKHNNWSFGTNKVPTLFEPGAKPAENLEFWLAMAATVRGVDLHSDLMRFAISGAGNDHRLGAQEAPPAIVSAYLGEDIEDAMNVFLGESVTRTEVDTSMDLGAGYLPNTPRATTDRNRTSTFAFTGNKFEFRAVGSSQPVGRSSTVLNTIVSESMDFMAAEIEKRGGGAAAAKEVAVETLKAHKRVIFGGDGYSAEWQEEAAKRGLNNLKTTADVLDVIVSPKNVELFQDRGVFSQGEWEARHEVFSEEYNTKINMESDMMQRMCNTMVLPSALEYQNMLGASVTATGSKVQAAHLQAISGSVDDLVSALATLNSATAAAASCQDFAKTVVPAMAQVREAADTLEGIVPADKWPLPSYHDMLFHQD